MNIIKHPATGFSIVELMISLTIGLLITVVVLQVFMDNRRTYQLEHELSRVLSSGEFLTQHITSITRMAGYRSLMAGAMTIPTLEDIYPSGGPYVSGTNDLGFNASDTLIVRYQGSGNGLGVPDNSVIDCLNAGVDSGDMVTNTFSINNSNQFICESVNETNGTTNSIVLIEGVENFQILFGEDLGDDNNADRYIYPGYPNINLQKIASVRFSILLRTNSEVNHTTDTRTYNLLGSDYDPEDDRRARRVFNATVQLRNVGYDAT